MEILKTSFLVTKVVIVGYQVKITNKECYSTQKAYILGKVFSNDVCAHV